MYRYNNEHYKYGNIFIDKPLLEKATYIYSVNENKFYKTIGSVPITLYHSDVNFFGEVQYLWNDILRVYFIESEDSTDDSTLLSKQIYKTLKREYSSLNKKLDDSGIYSIYVDVPRDLYDTCHVFTIDINTRKDNKNYIVCDSKGEVLNIREKLEEFYQEKLKEIDLVEKKGIKCVSVSEALFVGEFELQVRRIVKDFEEKESVHKVLLEECYNKLDETVGFVLTKYKNNINKILRVFKWYGEAYEYSIKYSDDKDAQYLIGRIDWNDRDKYKQGEVIDD